MTACLKLCSASILVFLLFYPAARGSIIVDASVSGTPGAFSYAYEIENQTAVGVLGFSLDVTGDVGGVGSPTGWVAGTAVISPGETLIDWVSTDVPFDAPPFGTLSGFLVASADGPGTVSFSTLDENFNFFDGSTIGPVVSLISEPSSLAILGLGLAWLFRSRRKLRCRRGVSGRPRTNAASRLQPSASLHVVGRAQPLMAMI
jgi:hypothetical protein